LLVDVIKIKEPSIFIDGSFVGLITGSSDFLEDLDTIILFLNKYLI